MFASLLCRLGLYSGFRFASQLCRQQYRVTWLCRFFAAGIASFFWGAGHAWAVAPPDSGFADLSLEQLGNIEVTTVSKKGERLADAAASIYVITNEAIKQSGVRTLPEALRLAPNLQVARINSNQYAISARGFNSSSANKLLVMIDGRTIYTPLYSGVFWDAQDVLFEDVERIEVISGPGGTLWGANAVNGVINIITKPAQATAGNFAYASVGNTGKSLAARTGGSLGGNGNGAEEGSGAYRVYAKFNKLDRSVTASGRTLLDGWNHQQAGFRADWAAATGNMTVQGDLYQDDIEALTGKQNNSGANLLGRLEKKLDGAASLKMQAYYDRTTRDSPGLFSEKLDMLDTDLQYSMGNDTDKQWVFGGGYRIASDRVVNSAALAFLPADKMLHWINLFAQHERVLQPGLRLSLGGKLEYNDYTGVEFLPDLKLAWKASNDTLIWAALSRAVRAPSRLDADFYIPGKAPFILAGSSDFKSEIAKTLDVGIRSQPSSAMSYSVTAYISQYDKLRGFATPQQGVYTLANTIDGRIYGLEMWANFQPAKTWTVNVGAVLQHEQFNGLNLALSPPGNDPRYQYQLTSKWNFNPQTDVAISLRRVGGLQASAIPAYTAVDANVSWRFAPKLELVLSGRNLLERRHAEFFSGGAANAANVIQVERAVDLALIVRF